MVVGKINKINLSISSFERLITEGCLYVDKTRLIEHFLETASDVQLIARQRRLGKTLNMDMLRCFLTDREDLRHLFKGLYIEKSPIWTKAYSAPVFYFDFKGLDLETYREQIIEKMIEHVCSFTDPKKLDFYLQRKFQQIIDNPKRATDSLYFLTEVAYNLTGKRSYLLIDEYDKLLMESYNTDKYENIKSFETALLSSALKGNKYLEKALLTGVMRVSHESMLSGLNNIVTFDVFGDEVYTDDYGLTDNEMNIICSLADFDRDEIRAWYNGIKIGGHAIYNIFSVMSYLARGNYDCYWGKSGTMDMISDLLNDTRKASIAKLLNGESVEVGIADRISDKASDQAFYSLLVQAGYLAFEGFVTNKSATAIVSIPNTELIMVWKQFLLENLHTTDPKFDVASGD